MLAAGLGLRQGASVHDDSVFVLGYARVIASVTLVCRPTPHFPSAPTKERRPAPMGRRPCSAGESTTLASSPWQQRV
jgi:hypothetical protein